MAKKAISLPTVANSIYDLLQPLEVADRMKAVNAALTLLGDPAIGGGGKRQQIPEEDDGGSGGSYAEVHPKARGWLRKYRITTEQLEHVFQLDGDTVEIIADDVPGKSAKEKTIEAYIVTGIGHYLKTGETTFDDTTGRAVCKHIGCLNEGNHARYLALRGNVLGGSKKAGWKLTAPGLKRGAELVQAIAGSE